MDNKQKLTEVINQWNSSAPYWEKHRATIQSMLAPVTLELIHDAEISPGQSVLDIASGTGEPALTIAGIVGEEGAVTGTDAAPDMVEAAQRQAQQIGLKNASFEVASTESLPFADSRFDAVVCRFGVMYFPSPAEAVAEWLRVLRPGGRIALAVWHYSAFNPFITIISEALSNYVETPPVEPDAPDPFRFAEPGKLRATLESAGVHGSAERLCQFNIQVPMSKESFWEMRLEMAEKSRASIAGLPETQQEALRHDVLESLRDYAVEGGLSFPAEVLIVSGRKRGT